MENSSTTDKLKVELQDILDLNNKELVIKGNYHIIGKISFIYKDDNGFNDLLVISCNDLTFFVDKKDFKNVCVKLGDWVEFSISSLEFYCMG